MGLSAGGRRSGAFYRSPRHATAFRIRLGLWVATLVTACAERSKRSAPISGATMSVSLPVEASRADAARTSDNSPAPSFCRRRRVQIRRSPCRLRARRLAVTGRDAHSAPKTITPRPVDLIVVDLGCPTWTAPIVGNRVALVTVPIIVLSVARRGRKVRLLELGADDYVVKPFGMAELLARARAALRRQSRSSSGEPAVRVGPLTIDLAARAVTVHDPRVQLSPKEYRLLQILAQHAGNVVTHQQLLKEVRARSTCTMHITCASSYASCARRSKTIRPSRGSWSPSSAWDIGLRRPSRPRPRVTKAARAGVYAKFTRADLVDTRLFTARTDTVPPSAPDAPSFRIATVGRARTQNFRQRCRRRP